MQVPLIRVVLGAAMLCGIVLAAEAPAFKSTAVKYAKINLSGDGAKALVLAFDESKGTGQGYDTIQVTPVGFKYAVKTLASKDIIQRNILTNKPRSSVSAGYLRREFETIALEPYAKAAGVTIPVFQNIAVEYTRNTPTAEIAINIFRAKCEVRKQAGADTWACAIPMPLQMADTPEVSRPLAILPEKPALKLDLRQIKNANDIGVVASTATGEQTVHITKNGQAPEVTVTVKAKNGDVVKKDSGPVGKFSLG